MNILLSCPGRELSVFLKVAKNFLTLVQIVAPILLIISLIFSFTQLAANPETKDGWKKIRNKIIATVIVFFIPLLVNVAIGLVTDSTYYNNCLDQEFEVDYNPHYIKTTDNDKLRKSFLTDPSDYEAGEKHEENNNSQSSSGVTATGKGSFTKYSLTDSQLRQVTALCLHEQGTAKGAAAEASLIANRFELYGASYGSGANGLVNYLRNCGWFAYASRNMSDTGVVTSAAYNAVKQVLVDGKRVLPKYVDEHDCFSDLSSVRNNNGQISIQNRQQYVSHVTKIRNRYGASYVFYSFPDTNSDPFGYTSEANRRLYGDDCYSLGG